MNKEGKKSEKEIRNKFKINKSFLYITSNLFFLYYLFYIQINTGKKQKDKVGEKLKKKIKLINYFYLIL